MKKLLGGVANHRLYLEWHALQERKPRTILHLQPLWKMENLVIPPHCMQTPMDLGSRSQYPTTTRLDSEMYLILVLCFCERMLLSPHQGCLQASVWYGAENWSQGGEVLREKVAVPLDDLSSSFNSWRRCPLCLVAATPSTALRPWCLCGLHETHLNGFPILRSSFPDPNLKPACLIPFTSVNKHGCWVAPRV